MSSVSPVGFDVGETHEALIRLRQVGFTPADLHRIAESDKVAQLVLDAVRGGAFHFMVDYSLSLEQMIAAGNFDWANSDITAERFPFEGIGKVALDGQLVHFGKDMTSEAVLAGLDKMGLRPATLPELLAFAAAYPEEQRKYPISGLGSIWRPPGGHRGVPCLCEHVRYRYLCLRWFEDDWLDHYRFLAFRK